MSAARLFRNQGKWESSSDVVHCPRVSTIFVPYKFYAYHTKFNTSLGKGYPGIHPVTVVNGVEIAAARRVDHIYRATKLLGGEKPGVSLHCVN